MAEELVTEAVILNSKSWSDGSRQVNLFTKELGKVKAKAKAGMKMTSKLSPHLNSLNLSEVRLIKNNNYLITDALTKERFGKVRKDPDSLARALEVSSLVNFISPSDLKDLELWYYLLVSLEKAEFSGEILLKILGYDPTLAECNMCKEKKVSYFIPLDQSFVCKRCSGKIDNSKLFKIE